MLARPAVARDHVRVLGVAAPAATWIRSVRVVRKLSGGTLTWQQTAELALGLEMSGQRFIWVVKTPNDDPLGCGSFFGSARRRLLE